MAVSDCSHGGKTEMPTEYILLDGCSLSTDDLVQLGNNMYKIKVNLNYPKLGTIIFDYFIKVGTRDMLYVVSSFVFTVD